MEKIRGVVDRVQGLRLTGPQHRFTRDHWKQDGRPSINENEGVSRLLISVVGSRFDSSTSSPSFLQRHRWKQSTGEAPWIVMGGLLACPTGHQTWQGLLLCDLCDKGFPFYSPTVAKMDHHRLAMATGFVLHFGLLCGDFDGSLASKDDMRWWLTPRPPCALQMSWKTVEARVWRWARV
jgi:hypothetical protein